jgi:hypothetical protein
MHENFCLFVTVIKPILTLYWYVYYFGYDDYYFFRIVFVNCWEAKPLFI